MPNMRIHFVVIGTALTTAFLGSNLSWAQLRSVAIHPGNAAAETADYNVAIDPNNFVRWISNQYFKFKPGIKYTYKNKTGKNRIEVVVTGETKMVMGVTTTVVLFRDWENGVLREETKDFYAQDKDGNVWYFGEAADNYKDGKLTDHKGSWEAGVNGAKPGIIMPGTPRIGETYRQEYSKGVAEDMGVIVATDKKVTVPFGSFENCLQTRDWSRLDPTVEYKYYCPFFGLILEESASGAALAELVDISYK